MNNLLQYRSKKQYEDVLNLLRETFPDNLVLENKLDKLITKRSSHIRKLLNKWVQRELPLYSEKDILELNLEFISDKATRLGDRLTRGFENQSIVDSKSWVLKQNNKWLGWNPENNKYFIAPIEFGGDLDFERNFENLVISDGQSHSINLIWTIENFLARGQEMGLCNEDWVQIFLIMAKKYLPLVFTSLSRHSVDADSLFKELVSQINLDNETAKLRSALSSITRKTSDQIHISLFRIKSLYQMVLGINQAHLTEQKVETRAEFLAISCIQFLVTPQTWVQFQTFLQMKSAEQEAIGCAEACNFLASQELVGAEFQLSTTLYLPKQCSMLDMACLEANSITDLVISTTSKQVQNKENGMRKNRTPERDSRSYYKNNNNRRYSKDRDTGRDNNRRQQEGGQRNNSPYGNKRYGSGDRVSRDRGQTRENGRDSGERQRRDSGERQRRDSGNRQRRGSVERQRRGSGERGQRRGSSEKDRGQRRYYENKGQNRTRSNSRQKGSPVRLTGCFRCSSTNHEAENCKRFGWYEGPACTHCSYLHESRFCPKFVRDKKQGGNRRDNGEKQVNSTELSSENNLGQKDTTVNNLLPNLFVTESKNKIQL
jgi:hypothetical protein